MQRLSMKSLRRVQQVLMGERFSIFGSWRHNVTQLQQMNRRLVAGRVVEIDDFLDTAHATQYRDELAHGRRRGWFVRNGDTPWESSGIDHAAFAASANATERCQLFREAARRGAPFHFRYHVLRPPEGTGAPTAESTPAMYRMASVLGSRAFVDAFGLLLTGEAAPVQASFNMPAIRILAPGDYVTLHNDRAQRQASADSHRALCLNYYITDPPVWERAWGGGLLWCGSDQHGEAEEEARLLDPAFNRANLFVPSSKSLHAVEVATDDGDAATRMRLSFTSWMGWQMPAT